MKINCVVLSLFALSLSSCATLFSGGTQQSALNQKNNDSMVQRKRGPAQETARRARMRPAPNSLPHSFQAAPNKNFTSNLPFTVAPLQLTRVGGNIWRTAANPMVVFGIMSRLLSQSYIISSVDRKNMNIQTEWDKFFIDGRLFRNRINITVFPVGNRMTEVVIKNAVEYYSGSVEKQEQNMAWLPSPDLTDEVSRLVQNTDKQTAFLYSQQNLR